MSEFKIEDVMILTRRTAAVLSHDDMVSTFTHLPTGISISGVKGCPANRRKAMEEIKKTVEERDE